MSIQPWGKLTTAAAVVWGGLLLGIAIHAYCYPD